MKWGAMPKSAPKSRKLTQPNYRSFKLSKRISQPKPKLLSSFKLLIVSFKTLWQNKRIFGSILLLYFILTLLFVMFQGQLSSTGLTANETTNNSAQALLFVLFSLVIIWTLRQTSGQKKTKRIKLSDSFYSSMYPLVPFMLVLLVIGLQLIPLSIANFLYTVLFAEGLATTPLEQVLWALLLIGLSILSLYMISSSIFSLYIVTLPNVRPMQALRSARDLVRFRRWAIIVKFLFLMAFCLILGAILIVPVAMTWPGAAAWEVTILGLVALVFVHSYLYHLYRELL